MPNNNNTQIIIIIQIQNNERDQHVATPEKDIEESEDEKRVKPDYGKIPERELHQHEWVAIAYDKDWYLGYIVVAHAEETAVKMLSARRLALHLGSSSFKLPAKPDIDLVKPEFILKVLNAPPEPTSGGRLFQITSMEHKECTDLCPKYKQTYFT